MAKCFDSALRKFFFKALRSILWDWRPLSMKRRGGMGEKSVRVGEKSVREGGTEGEDGGSA